MKKLILYLGLFMIYSVSCDKRTADDNCQRVTITQISTPCLQWGIKVNGVTYLSANIPAEFQAEGLHVCASFELYNDMRLCVCCGGTWANIKTMKNITR